HTPARTGARWAPATPVLRAPAPADPRHRPESSPPTRPQDPALPAAAPAQSPAPPPATFLRGVGPGRGGPHSGGHGPSHWSQEVAGSSRPPGWPARASGEMGWGGAPPRAPLSQEKAAGTVRTGGEVARGQCRGCSAQGRRLERRQ
ncbi:unnamed protein product, partial [Gulo gulo]